MLRKARVTLSLVLAPIVGNALVRPSQIMFTNVNVFDGVNEPQIYYTASN